MGRIANHAPTGANNLNNAYYTGDYEDLDALFRRGQFLGATNNVLNANGDLINMNNMMIEYALGELNYQRTNPQALARLYQAAGMSRSAALDAISGSAGSVTSVSPQPPSPPTAQPIFEGISTALQVAQGGFGLASAASKLPFDLRAKQLNNDASELRLKNDTDAYEGMRSAAKAIQFCSNVTNKTGYSESFKDLTPSQVLDKIRTSDDPVFASERQTDWFKSFESNPYALSSFMDYYGRDYSTGSQQYALNQAYENVRQTRLLNQVTDKYAQDIQPLLVKITEHQEVREGALAAYDDLVLREQAKADAEGSKFDKEHWDNLRAHIEDFKDIWGHQINIEMEELRQLDDIDLQMQHKAELLNSYRYQAAQFYLDYLFTNEVISQFEDIPFNERAGMANTYVRYNMFNQDARLDATVGRWTGSIRAGAAAGAAVGSLLVGGSAVKGLSKGLQLPVRVQPATIFTNSGGATIPNLRTGL